MGKEVEYQYRTVKVPLNNARARARILNREARLGWELVETNRGSIFSGKEIATLKRKKWVVAPDESESGAPTLAGDASAAQAGEMTPEQKQFWQRAGFAILAVLLVWALISNLLPDDSGAPSAPGAAAIETPEPETDETQAPRTYGGLASQVQSAFSDSYGWPSDRAWSAILKFTDRDAPRVTVVTDMAYKSENEEAAMGICRAVASISPNVSTDFTGVYVTAGDGGPHLAECRTFG